MPSYLQKPAEVIQQIVAGKSLLLAGEEKLLTQMPPGNWIGGTTPYFLNTMGGGFCQDQIMVTELPADLPVTLRAYGPNDLPQIYTDAAENEVTFLILPADAPVHVDFAMHVEGYRKFATNPLLGWVAGVSLPELGHRPPKVFCGQAKPLANHAAVLRLELSSDLIPQIHSINPFTPGPGAAIIFPQSGFTATTASVDGTNMDLTEYLARHQRHRHLPLIARQGSALINVSVKHFDPVNRRVSFYAPVKAGMVYRLGEPVADYYQKFAARLEELGNNELIFSCNCILNHINERLESRHAEFPGPIVFGEIAYQLTNQTRIYLTLEKIAPPARNPGFMTLSAGWQR